MPMTIYRTIADGIKDAEQQDICFAIQKSKFITHFAHVEAEEEARAFILAMKKRYFDARHNCSAYVLGRSAEQMKRKSNDDGEPGGTAGAPILEAIKQNGLTEIVVVVTRYFGGIKLGVGGLIRTYSRAAVLGLDAAQKVEMRPFCRCAVTVDYGLLASVEHWIRTESIRMEEPEYADRATLRLLVEPSDLPRRRAELTELTSAQFEAKEGDRTYLAIPC